jgi:ABC-2 type transport system permease protein
VSSPRALEGAPTFASNWLGFWVLAEKTLRAKFVYRLSLLVSLVANSLGYLVFFLVWSEVYRGGGGGALSSERLFPYLVTAFVLNFALSLNVEVRFGQRLRQGLITSDLLRPLGFMPFQLAQAVGDAAGNLVLVLPVLGLAMFEFGGAVLPGDAISLSAGLLSIALGLLVNFGVSYLVVQASFVTSSFYGVYFTRVALHQVFSGLSAPLVLFPPALRAVAEWMPFRHVVETPVRIWLGHAPLAEVPVLLAEQAAWAVGTLALSVSLFRVALGRHQVQGG